MLNDHQSFTHFPVIKTEDDIFLLITFLKDWLWHQEIFVATFFFTHPDSLEVCQYLKVEYSTFGQITKSIISTKWCKIFTIVL